MKRLMRIMTAAMVLATISIAADAQRGMRWMNDTSAMKRPGREFRQGQGNISRDDTARFRGRFPGRDGFYAWNGNRGAWRAPGYGPSGKFFAPVPWHGPGRGFGPGLYDFRGYNHMRPVPPARPGMQAPPMIERIPNLTEKQKKDLESLRQKQQEEMKKFREENRKKAETMKKTHMDNIRKILTPEQQKWLDEHQKPGGERK